jgi:hypothetical protein
MEQIGARFDERRRPLEPGEEAMEGGIRREGPVLDVAGKIVDGPV